MTSPNAARCANYRARCRDLRECEVDLLKKQIQYLTDRVEALENRVVDMETKQNQRDINFPPLDHVDMVANGHDMGIQPNQQVTPPAAPPASDAPRARVLELTLTSESQKERNKQTNARACEADFEAWWDHWPNKVGKPEARKVFTAALKKLPLPGLIDGVDRYMAQKPADQRWLNPATWLRQERWNDRPAPVAPRQQQEVRRYSGLFG